jgi:hypothetical protein
MKKELNEQAVVDQLKANTGELLADRIKDAYKLRDEKDRMRIIVTHQVEPNEFGEIVCKSGIRFGKRVAAKIEHIIDGHPSLDLDAAPANAVKGG